MFLEWRTANCLFLLDFYYCSLSTLCRGQLAPCTPRRAEPARPQLPAARILQPPLARFNEKLSFLCFPAAFRLSSAFLVPIARFLHLFVKCFRSLPTFHRKISDKSPAFFLEIAPFQTNFCNISAAIMIFAEILRKYFVEISKESCYNEGNQKESRMTHERKGTS